MGLRYLTEQRNRSHRLHPNHDAFKPNRPDFLWPELTAGFARVLSGTTLEKLCREAAQAAVRRSDDGAFTYQI